jgi:hypothetical protein
MTEMKNAWKPVVTGRSAVRRTLLALIMSLMASPALAAVPLDVLREEATLWISDQLEEG